MLHTPLYSRHLALQGKMVPFAGYSLPIQYSGIVKEHQAVRQQAGLFDVSHMGEIRVRGAGALAALNALITNDLAPAAIGQATYTCACNEQGGILDDLILYKFADDDFLIVCNASNRAKMVAHFSEQLARFPEVSWEDESDQTALLALQGPATFSILKQLDSSLPQLSTELAPFHFRSLTLLGHPAVLARTGYTGEDGVEIFCAPEDAAALWDALLESGAPHGLVPAGLGCRDTLRLEARLSLYGQEIDESIHPLEAGLGWVVKFHKADFLGKAALEQIQERGLTRRLVGFEMKGRGIARHAYPLVHPESGSVLGVCTSGGPSPTLGRAIGLGYVPLEFAQPGTAIAVDCRGKHIEAQVVKTPFYRRST